MRFILSKSTKRELKWKDAYKSGFKYCDSSRLAEEMQEEIEAFAARHGVHPDFDNDGSIIMWSPNGHVILYHGTTEDRAKAIMEEGFKTQGKHGKMIWFTKKPGQARKIARHRAEQRGEKAVVFGCEIALSKYSNFHRPNSDHYAFRHFHIDKDVIHSVTNAKDGPPNLIRRFIRETSFILPQPYGNYVSLWYGTTENRARTIMKEGFKPEKQSKMILFTRKSREARLMAKSKFKRLGERPVVFHCEIDLEEYSAFERPKPSHYAFRHSHIARDVILSVSGLEKDEMDDQLVEREEKGKPVNIIITQNAGKLGVLCWINCYLELNGKKTVSEDHPAVETIFKWVEAQYAAGRDEPISDEEMSMQVITHLKPEIKENGK